MFSKKFQFTEIFVSPTKHFTLVSKQECQQTMQSFFAGCVVTNLLFRQKCVFRYCITILGKYRLTFWH